MSEPVSPVFSFGKNWKNYLKSLNDKKIQHAERSLKNMLNVENLKNKRFLDAGCGSGLFSLAAVRLGAEEVVSFDVDQESVGCARHLSKKFGPYPQWLIKTGSVLDADFLSQQGKFDVVYSWGVLHHTGRMWEALDNITIPVKPGGQLFIAIYNDQGVVSQLWEKIKWLYNMSSIPIRKTMVGGYYFIVLGVKTLQGIRSLQPPSKWFAYSDERGMNIWYDVVDWIGGYPFETATPEAITLFFRKRKFELTNIIKKSGSGCNEFVFTLIGN